MAFGAAISASSQMRREVTDEGHPFGIPDQPDSPYWMDSVISVMARNLVIP
jgi:hypothetical protein